MPSSLPSGEPAPGDGALPEDVVAQVGTAPLGIYLHVPYCTARCGYCDFTTYTAEELGRGPGASRATWADTALAELSLARRVLGEAAPPASTVFVGGGTPSLLAASDLARVLRGIDGLFGLVPGAEVTTEANPESTTPAWLQQVREAGVTRLSLGMQSARPHVLAVLDRTHDPARVPVVVEAARSAGFASVSVDLIYGTPGETVDDWQHSLDAALAMSPDHVSAYALIVEPGTRLAAQVARGQVPCPDDDLMAAMYEVADDRFEALRWQWYEISSWARDAAHRSRHNQLYWSDADWWGVGPGAHSHVRGVRWWNVRHPAAWAARLAAGDSPAAAREVLDDSARRMERVMLGLRTRHGAAVADVVAASVPGLVADGLVDAQGLPEGRVVLTRRGRLLADAVTLRLVRR